MLSPLNFDPLKVVVALVEYIFDCLQGWALNHNKEQVNTGDFWFFRLITALYRL